MKWLVFLILFLPFSVYADKESDIEDREELFQMIVKCFHPIGLSYIPFSWKNAIEDEKHLMENYAGVISVKDVKSGNIYEIRFKLRDRMRSGKAQQKVEIIEDTSPYTINEECFISRWFP
jgi:hypothetical protein